MIPTFYYLVLSVILFTIGVVGMVVRRNFITVLMCVELILNAANINFIAFWRFGPSPAPASGVIFVLFSIAVAAAEAAVGLALIIAVYRHQKSVRLQDATCLKG